MTYINRQDAGQRLAQALRRFRNRDTVVLALPRGGVVLGAEVAKVLSAPLGLVLVRKIGHPSYPEYAIGAIAEDEEPLYTKDELLRVDGVWLNSAVVTAKRLISHRRELYYGDDFTPPELADKTVILVDDGIATGLTMKAAVRAMRNKHVKRVIVAVPIAPKDSTDELEIIADEVIALENPDDFLGAVGSYYKDFEQVDDEEVGELLREVRDDVHKAVATNR